MKKVENILASLRSVPGIEALYPMREEDLHRLLDVETEAEKKAFMGLGMCYNSGIREVLRCPSVAVGITTMDFQWGCQSHLLLKKDDDIVGEEISDPDRIAELKQRSDVWFMHRNFVVYKDKVNFPDDIVSKKCCFDIPALHFDDDFSTDEDLKSVVFCFPSTAGDVFLKKTYHAGVDEHGAGTVVFGIPVKE